MPRCCRCGALRWLANPDLLRLAERAELISVGKHGSGPLWSQDEINAKLIELARAGGRIVRLKGGDPAVFARTAEEWKPSRLLASHSKLCGHHRGAGGRQLRRHTDYSSASCIRRGLYHWSATIRWRSRTRLASLARFPGTLVFYMGVTTAASWSQRLIAEGKSPDTPAAIVRRCTWSDQRVIRCALSDVADQLTPASKLRPPVIVIIGPVSNLGEEFNWFDALPLRGQGIWLTRRLSRMSVWLVH